jgi:AraC-like DNA-binding protein
MSPGSAQSHIATATAGYPSTIASIGLGTRDAAGRESNAAILVRLVDGAGKGIHRDAASVDPWHTQVTPTRGGLAPWQVLRIKAHVEAHLDSTVRARDLAAIARLSPGHFSRAFKRSLGVAPAAYIAGRRVARAQTMMLTTNEPLCQIALACGFYDQSHLTRVFRRCAGASPHDWRRRHRDDVTAPRAREYRHAPRTVVADKSEERLTRPHGRSLTTFA